MTCSDNVGREVLAKQLPTYFAGQFGGSKRVELQAKVEKKISKELEALAYDWCKHHGCTGTQCSSHAGAFPL